MSRWLHLAQGGDLHNVSDDNIHDARHAYYGMCTYIDDKVGHLLDSLEDLGLEDDTVIVFTSDHGDMLGERSMWFKQTFYEWSVTVPMIIKIPGVKSKVRVKELVSLVDLLPTFMDIANGGKVSEAVTPQDGNSLLPLMRRYVKNWNNRVISEYTGEGVVAPCRMLRRDNIKFIYTHGHPDLMYDLASDPNELNNLIGHADYIITAEQLKAELLTDWNPDQINEKCIQSQKERLFIQRATDGNPNWAFCYDADDSNRFIRNDSAVATKAKARYPYVEPTPFIKKDI